MNQAAVRLDVEAEVAALTAELEARRDPGYEAGMRRTVPSAQKAHATRIPDVRKAASQWRASHRGLAMDDLLAVAEALWATAWREERLAAIDLLRPAKMLSAVDWRLIERWSGDIDNWELVDHLADVSGRLLIVDPDLIPKVRVMSESDNPWQRRLALVTFIVAFMKADGAWRSELSEMSERLRKDSHPLVRRAVAWARDRLGKDHIDG